MTLSRRKFFSIAGATAATTLAASPLEGLLARAAFGQTALTTTGYGSLSVRPDNRTGQSLLAIPQGFQYTVISRADDIMADGFPVPSLHDGMGSFQGPRGTTILVCNHEIDGTGSTGKVQVPNDLAYDPVCRGGTTTIVVNSTTRQLVRQFGSLGGTIRNCAGGVTPWGSWISSEENLSTPGSGRVQFHGYNFEVPANATSPVLAVPLKDMGRFNHEGVAVDPATGIVYETEDSTPSRFYRFIPNVPGELAKGGKLQALRIGTTNTSFNTGATNLVTGTTWQVNWVDIPNPDATSGQSTAAQGASRGAATFARGEGIWYGNGEIYFASTSGGPGGRGQIFRYVPATDTLQLFVQSPAATDLRAPDNICVAPFGDIIICEDGAAPNFVRGVTPDGKLYNIARNNLNNGDSEFAGACFSPDGQTLFVNIQSPGITLAIWGPWGTRI